VLLLGLAALLPLLVAGCASNVNMNPALKVEPKDMEAAKQRGVGLLNAGADPYSVYSWTTKSVNVRVSGDVVLQDAALCLPKDEIAFAIAKSGDKSEAGVNRAAEEAAQRASNEVKFSVVLQVAKAKDPTSVQFEMRTNTGQSYPPLAVEAPTFIRDIVSALDPTAPPGALYGYDVRFPARGSPGYPPIDISVSSVTLVVKDGQSEGSADFYLTTTPRRGY